MTEERTTSIFKDRRWKTEIPPPDGQLCEYCIPQMGEVVAKPATIFCPGCNRFLCDLCLECH